MSRGLSPGSPLSSPDSSRKVRRRATIFPKHLLVFIYLILCFVFILTVKHYLQRLLTFKFILLSFQKLPAGAVKTIA